MQPGRVSQTARRVAAQRLAFTRVPGEGDADADLALHRAVARDLVVEPTAMTRYLTARTAFFDRAVTESEAPQIVVLGAGYDGRSLRYARAGVRWFEVDHPDTQSDKLAIIDALGIDASAVAFIPADFLDPDLGDQLAGAGHDIRKPTLFVCEGVLTYLLPGTSRRLLAASADRAAPGSALVAEIAVSPIAADPVRERVRADVTRMGEEMADPWPRAELSARLAVTGWLLESAVDARGQDISSSELTAALVSAARMSVQPDGREA